VDSRNVVNWIQNILLHCVVLFTTIALQQRLDCLNVVNWIQKIVLHFVLLLILIAVKQSV